MAEIIRIDENTWRFEDDFVRFFLLEGKDKAVLIDSGVNCPNALDMAKTLTTKPVLLLNTHGDGDHTSGTAAFSKIHIHPLDYMECKIDVRFPSTKLSAVDEGSVIELGDRPLKIYHIPGHTKGSIAILDVAKRVLFTGDSVQTGHIYMFGEKREPESYKDSLDRIMELSDKYDYIYASHADFKLPASYTEKVKNAWIRVRDGEVPFETIELHGMMVKSYTTEDCGFYMA